MRMSSNHFHKSALGLRVWSNIFTCCMRKLSNGSSVSHRSLQWRKILPLWTHRHKSHMYRQRLRTTICKAAGKPIPCRYTYFHVIESCLPQENRIINRAVDKKTSCANRPHYILNHDPHSGLIGNFYKSEPRRN